MKSEIEAVLDYAESVLGTVKKSAKPVLSVSENGTVLGKKRLDDWLQDCQAVDDCITSARKQYAPLGQADPLMTPELAWKCFGKAEELKSKYLLRTEMY